MTLKQRVERVHDQDSLVELLRDGVGWPVDPEFAFFEVPEIAAGVKSDSAVTVSQLVPASAEDKHLIVLAEFEKHYVRRDLLELLRSLRSHMRATGKFEGHTGIGDTVFIVAAPKYEDVRFVLFEERERRKARIRSFGWRSEFVGRTVLTHNLERLKWQQDPTARASAWERAWDVEGLTEQFYKDYESVFRQVLAQVQGAPDDKTRHSWTQLLFNRLLFIAFIQRMGWLQVPGGSRDGFLFDLYRAPKGEFTTFYGMLRAVFAELDTPDEDPRKDRFINVFGHVPYLNGGLFDRDDPLDQRPDITVPDEAFAAILAEPDGLFARYNFTVTESTPLDQEVAVDPEMLGKIFERLIIQQERHQSGTYYTPRPIVEFMVNEALKGYLVERGLPPEKAAMLVDEDRVEPNPEQIQTNPSQPERPQTAFLPSELQQTLDWLLEVRAVDPACGSGAYLLMLLQRLFELVDRLEVSRDKRRNPGQKHLYETKLRLLQRCVYGVDMNETAVRIARLRLWLSLVVENKGEKPEPLPNFDFLIMQGDSLASPLFPAQNVLGYPHDEIREYTRMKRRYFHPSDGEQRPTREEMKAQRKLISDAFADELSSSKLRSLSPMPFDWEVEFAEVFDPQTSHETAGGRQKLGMEPARKSQGEFAEGSRGAPGFDIVLANPPYVRKEEIPPEYKKEYLKEYAGAFTGRSDLYCCFFARGMQLLKHGGRHAFICSTAWLDAQYGYILQRFLLSNSDILYVIDSAVEKQFTTANVNTAITILRKGKDGNLPAKFILLRDQFDFAIHNPAKHRERSFTQASLWGMGAIDGKYCGAKWGGRLLRGPDVYERLLKNPKLKPLGQICRIEGYIHDNSLGPEFPGASVLKSVKDARSILIGQEDSGLVSTGVASSDERDLFAPILFPRTFGARHLVPLVEVPILGKEFYRVTPGLQSDLLAIAAQLNSTLGVLQREILGIRGLGGGAIKFAREDVAMFRVMPGDSLPPELPELFSALARRPVRDPADEVKMPDRQRLDEAIFDALGLTDSERACVLQATVEMVEDRLRRGSNT
ncbi:MAG: hypothetical protein AMXMBFR81_19190 [Chthonomonas sp.]